MCFPISCGLIIHFLHFARSTRSLLILHLFRGKVRAGTRYLIGQRSMHGAGASEVTRLVQVITTMRIELCEGLTTMYLIEQCQFGSSIFIENSSFGLSFGKVHFCEFEDNRSLFV